MAFAIPFPPLVFEITKYIFMPVMLKWYRYFMHKTAMKLNKLRRLGGQGLYITSKFTLCNSYP